MAENYNDLDARIKRELELIRQMDDHDLLIQIAEQMIYVKHQVSLQDKRLWGIGFTFGLAILTLMFKAFLT